MYLEVFLSHLSKLVLFGVDRSLDLLHTQTNFSSKYVSNMFTHLNSLEIVSQLTDRNGQTIDDKFISTLCFLCQQSEPRTPGQSSHDYQ